MEIQGKIGILGLGYVGLPLALRFAETGADVLGFEIDQRKIENINNGSSYIRHIPSERIKSLLEKFQATPDFSRVAECKALIICVPTPLTKHREPDLSYIVDTAKKIAPYLKKDQLISLESTTYPGTTEEVLKPLFEDTGLKVGEDLFLVYSPEREDPGNPNFKTQTIPKVVGGSTKKCLKHGVELYSTVVDTVVPVSSTQTAELTKLLENIHRAVNIGLVNEMKIVADKMDIDIHEVIDAAATKPFGFKAYYPGPGLGGHCIPIDPFYLTWKAKEYGINTRFIELAGEVNRDMPNYVLKKTSDSLNQMKKSVKGSKILILGASYKKNVEDIRESPSLILIKELKIDGAEVDYSDPFVPNLSISKTPSFDLSSVALTPESISSYDCVILVTNHNDFDYNMIEEHSKLIVDTRGVYKDSSSKHIFRA